MDARTRNVDKGWRCRDARPLQTPQAAATACESLPSQIRAPADTMTHPIREDPECTVCRRKRKVKRDMAASCDNLL